MLWFTNKKKRRLEMLKGMSVTSKSSLKMQCLYACKGDIKEAKELYDFFAADMGDLPDHDPIAPTMLEQVKDGATGLVGWMRENQDTLMQTYDFLRGVFHKGAPLPPPSTPLPPINE